MENKVILKKVRLTLPAGKATVAPPVGSMLGQYGINMMDFCKAFNAETKSLENNISIPVLVTVYKDKSFSFIVKKPRVSFLLKKLYQKNKSYGIPYVSLLDIYKIALVKANNETELKSICKSIIGSCRSMRLKIK